MPLTRPRFEQLNTIVTSFTDPISVLNKGSSLANIDVGFIFNRDGGTSSNVAVFWDESANTFVTSFTTDSGSNNANITITEYANLRVGTITATLVNTTGNIMSAGNITAPYYFGNGSQLSGVITSVTKIINGTSDITAYSDSNIAVSVGGTANTVVFTSSNLYIAGSILPTANIIYDLGSPTQRFRTGYFSANTIDIGGGTIGLHDTLGFTFTTPGGNTQFMMPNGASTSNTFTSSTVTIQGNLAVDGNIITIGNVSGQYILGSGQFLTGLPASYSNINVKAYTESMGFANYSNVNLAAYLGGSVSVGGNLTIQGNLTVQGTITTINSTTLDVTDLNITVAKGAVNAAASNGAGLTVDGAGATLLYTSSTDSWNINKAFISNSLVNTTGNISTAQLNAGQLNTTGNVLATAGVFNALTVNGLVNSTGNVLAANVNASYFVGSGTAITGINSFGNIFIEGQGPVLADNTSDTLTLVAGAGISITTDAANDSVTFTTVSTLGAFAADGDFGLVTDPVSVSEDQGDLASTNSTTYDLGSLVEASGLIYPGQLVLPSYTVTLLPSAEIAAQLVYVSDETGGAVLAFSDGTNWRRVTDRAIVS